MTLSFLFLVLKLDVKRCPELNNQSTLIYDRCFFEDKISWFNSGITEDSCISDNGFYTSVYNNYASTSDLKVVLDTYNNGTITVGRGEIKSFCGNSIEVTCDGSCYISYWNNDHRVKAGFFITEIAGFSFSINDETIPQSFSYFFDFGSQTKSSPVNISHPSVGSSIKLFHYDYDGEELVVDGYSSSVENSVIKFSSPGMVQVRSSKNTPVTLKLIIGSSTRIPSYFTNVVNMGPVYNFPSSSTENDVSYIEQSWNLTEKIVYPGVQVTWWIHFNYLMIAFSAIIVVATLVCCWLVYRTLKWHIYAIEARFDDSMLTYL